MLGAALAALMIASYALALYGPVAAQDGGDGVEQRGEDAGGGPEPKIDPDAPPGCYRHPDLGNIIVCPTASISANPTSIDRGHSSTLEWTTSYATEVSINQGIGAVGASGTRSVSPTSTTTYTLTNLSPADAITDSVTVTVRPPPPAPSNFRATDVSENSLTLRWDGIQHIELYQVADYSSDVRATSYPVTGLQPCTAYTFKVRAHGDGSIYARTWGAWSTASETTGCPRPTGRIWVDSGSIDIGQSTTLRWETQHATSVSIDQGIGAVGASGSRSISPTSNTTYTLTASGPGGSLSPPKPSVMVTVVIPDPTGSISANPTSVAYNGCTYLTWSTANAARVQVEPNVSTSASGNRVGRCNLTSNTTFTLNAWNAANQKFELGSVTVTAGPPGPTGRIWADATNIDPGQSTTLRWETQHATSVSINQGIGTVAASGSRSISPTSTTTYTLTASGPGGSLNPKPSETVNVGLPLPPAPSNFNATSASETSINLSWSPRDPIELYQVEHYSSEIRATSYRVPNLVCGTEYSFRVRAHGDGSTYARQWGAWASTSGTPECPKAPPPTGLSASAASPTSISLSWNPVNGAHRYLVERSPNGSSGWRDVNSDISGTSYTVTGLTHSTTYYFRVSAKGDGHPYSTNWGNPSEIASATTQTEDGTNRLPSFAQSSYTFAIAGNAGAGTAVGSVTATDPDAGDTVTHSITAGNAAGKFTIDSGNGAITVRTALSHANTASYTLTIQAIDSNEGIATTSVTVTAIGKVTLETPSPGNQSLTVRWSAPGHIGSNTISYSYKVLYRAPPADWPSDDQAEAVTSTVWTKQGLTNGTTYEIRVRACIGNVCGAWSNVVSVMLPTTPPVVTAPARWGC